MSADPGNPPRRVLLIKPSALGDVMTALPVLHGLRRAFPEAHIAWLIKDSLAEAIAHEPDLDEVIEFRRKEIGRAWRSLAGLRELRALKRRLREGRFDWAIDLQGLFRSGWLAGATRAPLRIGFADAREGAGMFYTQTVDAPVASTHTVDRNLAVCGALGVEAGQAEFRLTVSEAGRRFAQAFLSERSLQPGRYLVVNAPTTWSTKRLPLRTWRKVVTELSGQVPIVLTGTPADVDLCERIGDDAPGEVHVSAGLTGIAEYIALIAASAGVVGCDSAAKFIAEAAGVGSVTLIGPTRAERTGPWRRGETLRAPVPCQGCLKKRCSHVTCMELIEPHAVLAAVREMLERSG